MLCEESMNITLFEHMYKCMKWTYNGQVASAHLHLSDHLISRLRIAGSLSFQYMVTILLYEDKFVLFQEALHCTTNGCDIISLW